MKKNAGGIFLFFIYIFFLVSASFAKAENTTLYLGSIERTFDEKGNLSLEKSYIGVGGSAIARITDNTLPISQRNKTHYLYSNHLGSTAIITEERGNIVSFITYYPYGDIRENHNNKEDRLYTGQRKDSLSSLYFYNARYYNPVSSHFISADKAEGPNRYSYVGNNPVGRNDPSGNKEMSSSSGPAEYTSEWYDLHYKGSSYRIPWYNTMLRPEHPTRQLAYEHMVSDSANKNVTNTMSLLVDISNYIYTNFKYNPKFASANKNKIYYAQEVKANKEKEDAYFEQMSNDEDISQLKKYNRLKKETNTSMVKHSLSVNDLSMTVSKMEETTELWDQLSTNQGVCAQFALAGQFIANNKGLNLSYQVFDVVDENNNHILTHAVNAGYIDGKMVIMDPTSNYVAYKDEYVNELKYIFGVGMKDIILRQVYTGLER